MRRYYLTCPVDTPSPPPPHEQITAGGYDAHRPATQACRFAPLDDPLNFWIDGERSPATPAWMGRNYRCTTHNRRPTIHQRAWSTYNHRLRLMRDSGLYHAVTYTNREIEPAYADRYQPYPEDWPHRQPSWGTTVWIANRPRPRTSHSGW